MLRLRTKVMKQLIVPGVFIAALITLVGFQDARVAAQGQRLFSIVVHFEYENGFEFDYVLQSGVPAADLGAALGECGRSHSTPSVVRYHCFAVPE